MLLNISNSSQRRPSPGMLRGGGRGEAWQQRSLHTGRLYRYLERGCPGHAEGGDEVFAGEKRLRSFAGELATLERVKR